MQIFKTRLFQTQLLAILKYIAQDKINASERFYDDLNKQIDDLASSPFKWRKSFYSDDINVRDMVFKKYTIQYKIYKHKINVLQIFNKNKPSNNQ